MAILDKYNVTIGTVIKVASIVVGVVVWWMTFSSTMNAFINTAISQHQELLKQHRETSPILRQICRNTAKTEMALGKCDVELE